MPEHECESTKGKAVKVYTVNVERLKEIVEVAITQFNELLDEDDRWLDRHSPQFRNEFVRREKAAKEMLRLRQFAIDNGVKGWEDNYINGLMAGVQTVRTIDKED